LYFWSIMAYVLKTVKSLFTLIAVVRLLFFIRLRKSTGPLVVAIGKMFNDIFSFLVLSAILLFGFSQIFTVLFKNELTSYHTYWSSMAQLSQATFQNFQFFEPEDGGLSFIYAVGNFVLSLYLLFSVIILIHLLVSMMSYTYSEVHSASLYAWGFQFAALVIRYEETYWTPPLNIFYLLFVSIQKCLSQNKAVINYDQEIELRPLNEPNPENLKWSNYKPYYHHQTKTARRLILLFQPDPNNRLQINDKQEKALEEEMIEEGRLKKESVRKFRERWDSGENKWDKGKEKDKRRSRTEGDIQSLNLEKGNRHLKLLLHPTITVDAPPNKESLEKSRQTDVPILNESLCTTEDLSTRSEKTTPRSSSPEQKILFI